MGRRSGGDFSGLMGLFLGDQTAQLNPDFNKYEMYDDGSWVDKSTGATVDDATALKNPNTPYTQPSLTTRVFHPDVASQEAGENNAYLLAPKFASQRDDIAKSEWTRNVYNNNPAMQQMYPDPDIAYSNVGQHAQFNSTDRLPIDAASANLAAGNPKAAATAANSAYQAADAESKNAFARATGFSLQGGPSMQALQDYLGAKAGVGTANSQIYHQPMADQLLTLEQGNGIRNQSEVVAPQITNQANVVAGQAAAIPFNNQTALNQAKIDAGNSSTALEYSPYARQALANQLVGNAFQTGRLPNPSTPLETLINAREGTVTPGSRASGYSPFAGIDAMKAGSQPQVAPPLGAIDKSTGQPISAPPSSLYNSKTVSVLPKTGAAPAEPKVVKDSHPAAIADQRPVVGHEDYSYDSAGNIYYHGKKVEVNDGTPVKNAVFHQLHEAKQNEMRQNILSQQQRPAINSLNVMGQGARDLGNGAYQYSGIPAIGNLIGKYRDAMNSLYQGTQ